MQEKRELRKKLMDELSQIALPAYEEWSYQIARRLYNDPYWKDADLIAVTISRVPEVDTFQLIRKAWEEGKRIVVPKCEHHTRKLDFREITKFSQLEKGYYGLFEPIPQETKRVLPESIDLVIVPGLAFTDKGHRLGFGGGYYDRFLENYQGNTLSLAFLKQIVQELPVEGHDRCVDKIITDAGVVLNGN